MNPLAFAAVASFGLAASCAFGWVLDPSDWYRRCAYGFLVSGAVLTGAAFIGEATPDQRRVTVEAMAFAGKAVLVCVCVFMLGCAAVVVAHRGRH